ncbi:MAG: hypothetical protein WDN69_12940 [Aliidongia sp.]
MSNLGLERYLGGLGLNLARTAVGDRYVVEHMREHGYNIGGEQSGHIHPAGSFDHRRRADRGTAGAGRADRARRHGERGRPRLHAVCRSAMTSVRFAAGRDVMKLPIVERAIAEAETRLNGTGRLLIRKSGTEPVIRVMAEAEDERLVQALVEELAATIAAAAA